MFSEEFSKTVFPVINQYGCVKEAERDLGN